MRLRPACENCGLVLEPLEGNSWWFMYYSTAFLTGVVIIGMLLMPPANIWVGRAVVLIAALSLYMVSFPFRKGLAVAIDFLSEPQDLRVEGREGQGPEEP